MGFEVVDIQPTPNPNAMKFVLNRSIADNTMRIHAPNVGFVHAASNGRITKPARVDTRSRKATG